MERNRECLDSIAEIAAAGNQVPDPAVAFVFSIAAPPAPTPPTPPLPGGKEGKKRSFLWSFPPLSLGERGAGGVRAAGAVTLKQRRQRDRRSEFTATLTEPCPHRAPSNRSNPRLIS